MQTCFEKDSVLWVIFIHMHILLSTILACSFPKQSYIEWVSLEAHIGSDQSFHQSFSFKPIPATVLFHLHCEGQYTCMHSSIALEFYRECQFHWNAQKDPAIHIHLHRCTFYLKNLSWSVSWRNRMKIEILRGFCWLKKYCTFSFHEIICY